MKKRIFCIALTVFLMMSLFVFPVSAENASGTCGENATWTFDSDTGTLTISGTGAIADVNTCLWWGRTEITALVIGEGITHIGRRAFNYLDGLKTVKFPSTLETIGEEAFAHCWNLKELNLPNSLTYIGKRAFESCSSLTSLVIPDSVTGCEELAFSGCKGLTSVKLPANLEKIPSSMLAYCESLTTITIPAGVKEWGAWPFRYCVKLSSVTFQGDAPAFHECAFHNNELVVRYPAGNPTWTESVRQNYDGTITWLPDGDAPVGGTFGRVVTMTWKLDKGVLTITGDGYMDGWRNGYDTPWYPYRGMIKKVVLSGKLENIYVGAFRNHTELTEIQWADTITTIFDGAFAGCNKLKAVTIPNTVKNMGESVFNGCTSLTSVKLPENLTELGGWTFNGCKSLESVTIPPKVKWLGTGIFQDGPQKIYFTGNIPETLQKPGAYSAGTFGGVEATVYYPADNSTWTAAKIKEQTDYYGGKVKFEASEALNKPAGNTGNGGGQSTPKPTEPKPTEPKPAIPTAPMVEPTVPQTTAPTLPVTLPETTPETVPTASTGEATTQPTEPTPEQKPGGNGGAPWIVTVIVVAFAAGGVATAVFWRKKKTRK